MARKVEETRVNLVRPLSGEYYAPVESWEIVALGDKVRIEDAKIYNKGKMHITYYIRMDQ